MGMVWEQIHTDIFTSYEG